MGMMDFLKKPKVQEPFIETTFECKRGCLTVRGTEYRPEGENLPVAIVCHGFMAWQDTVRQYAKELARMGYCAYCFDFCGGSVMKKGKSDGATTDMSVLTEVQDLEAVMHGNMEFTEVITRRESIRKFDGRKPSEAQLAEILEAGRWAPTAFNKQPQRVLILESEEALAKMDQVHPCRYGAKLVLLVCGDATAAAGHGSNSTAATDATIAATQMLLAACNAGVDSVWAGVHEPEKTREVFGLPETMIPICFIDLGFRPEGFKGNRDHGKRNPVEAMVTRL